MSELIARDDVESAITLFEDDEPRRELSKLRILVVIVALAGMIFAAENGIRRTLAAGSAPLAPTWFAPYVDSTLTPVFNFQSPSANPARQIVLGFIVAEPGGKCVPSWGGYYTLPGAESGLNLNQRIAEYRQLGGQIAISFGGQANEPLASACSSTAALASAYRAVINRYRPTVLDFDIEGTAVGDGTSITRRAKALARLEHHYRGPRTLRVWLTLPVSPTGLTPDALNVIRAMLAAHVSLAGVNVMTMDFGVPEPDMIATVEQALSATAGSLEAIDARYGVKLSGASLWNHLGATVMIGQNDTPGEQFQTSDASQLVAFAKSRHLGRISMWSENRDAPCGASFATVGQLSNFCSGVAQKDLQFSHTFDALSGNMRTGVVRARLGAVTVDTNPANAPYPIWQPAFSYETGYKVVREGYIYQAKWFNQGQDPAASVAYAWQTPWLLIGPVLQSDHAPTTTTLPRGTYPTWSATAVYQAGARVLFRGLPYRAAWYNVHASPASALADPNSSPWKALYTIPGEPRS